ncbi:MAG TPA: serine hydrolase [Kiritimatiellia bacterium]|jgi:CubicO group peptidase (beta-lactamase class C family)|nr:serine hydrolase [Kiritimatiellia bacterium]
MKLTRTAVSSVFVVLFACLSRAFEVSKPEMEGISSGAILGWVEAVESNVDALHSFVLLRHGKIVAEGWWAPFEKERPHMLYSLSKSFTSTAVGFAVEEGRLSLDDTVVSFFPDKVPERPSENLAKMRVRDLLCMGSGNANDTFTPMKEGAETDWIKVFFAQPVEHEPGTFFRYNTGVTYMLSAIVQKATGQKVADYLKPRLFTPLGMEKPAWETSAQGITTGGYGLKVRTRDIAALGQLYLQKGMWNGKRLLSEKWVAAATDRQISNGDNPESDWSQGYGFQFWRCRHNAFRGDGAFGQYCLVMPDQDAVLAITSGLGDMQQVLNLIWANLLPGIRAQALPADDASQARLTDKLSKLTLRPAQGQSESAASAGTLGKTFVFDNNEKGLQALSLNRDGQGLYLTIRNAHGEQRLDCGFGRWSTGELTFEKSLTAPLNTTNGRQPVAASGAWLAPNLFQAVIYFCETPYRLTLTLRFKDDRQYLDLDYNVMFGPKKKWSLIGRPVAPAS